MNPLETILRPLRAIAGDRRENFAFCDALEEIASLGQASLSGGVTIHKVEGWRMLKPQMVARTYVLFEGAGLQVAERFRHVQIPVLSGSSVVYTSACDYEGLLVVKHYDRDSIRFRLVGELVDPSKHRMLGLWHEHLYRYGYDVNFSFLGNATVAAYPI